ncbi:MAG: hypothetical protein IKY21_03460, partial [Clostridia bacterium]|nr:hypothetical protein [Clostridia bacterium]
MKKFLSLLLVAVLVSAMFVVPVSADDEMYWAEGEYELVADNNVQPYHAWGYEFTIDSVNSTTGAATAIFDNATDYAAKGPGKWTTQLLLAPVAGEEGVYEVIAAHKTTGKNAQANLDDGTIDFNDGKIVLSVQDSGTRPEKNEDGTLRFPNWEDRAASWGLLYTFSEKAIKAKMTYDSAAMTLTVEADPSKVEDDTEKETVSINLIDKATPWEVTGNGSFSYEGDVLTVNAVENWPCIQAYYAEAITVTVADYYLEYDFTVEGAANMNFIFGNGGTFSISNSALSLEEGQVDAGSGDLLAGSYKGVIALSDLVAATANYQSAAFPAAEVVDGELTFAGLNIFSVGTDVDVVVNKFALVTEVEGDGEVTEITNVALNKEYEISGVGNRDSYYGNVTDGFVAADLGENKNAEWFGFYHNGDRPTNAPDKVGYFIIDLEDEYTLTSARVHFTNMTSWGIVAPEAVTAYVSLDGNAYEEIGSFEGIIADDDFYWVNLEGLNCKAKFVKIEVKLGGTFAFVSEVEVYGGKPGAGGSTEEPKEDVEAEMKELLGAAPADAKVDYVIEAPESYEAGDEITVTVTVKNITAENGIHVAAFKLLYDN